MNIWILDLLIFPLYLEAGTRRVGVEELAMILPPWRGRGSDRGGCGFKYRNLKAFGGFKSWNLKDFGGVKYWDLKAFVENIAGD